MCGRVEELEPHHLIPRSQQKKARFEKMYGRKEMRALQVWICHPCHRNLHRRLHDRELAEHCSTLETLKEHPEVKKFSEWIAKKPAGFIPVGF
ncbi:MAG: hypothetical protein OHK005_21260 [Candidatus Methylacidiphilales bacterium]